MALRTVDSDSPFAGAEELKTVPIGASQFTRRRFSGSASRGLPWEEGGAPGPRDGAIYTSRSFRANAGELVKYVLLDYPVTAIL